MGRIALNERLIGYDSNGKKCIICDFICDSVSDLPTQTVYTDYVLMIGCTASMIDSGDIYKINSAGTWTLSQAGTGTYTKSEIDALLNAKQDVLTFDATPTQNSTNPVTSGGMWTDQQRQDGLQSEDRAALVEMVDGGAKNLTNIQKIGDTVSNVGTTVTHNGVTFELQTDGSVVVNRVSTNANDSYVFFRDSLGTGINVKKFCDGQHVISGIDGGSNATYWMFINNLGGGTVPFYTASITPVSTAASNNFGVRIRSSYSPNNLVINPMFCSKAAWDISHEYQPYRPSWQEMYEMILALQ